ncbi:hypothetical protein Syun_009723 [Stephania yunnanensis]|uniref:Subtilisin-like protease fibronectin type-III domain-containing protein n=1 Tax=Stephania yunnanensis TaxID=152371 RepID=A0AAP0KGY3_9MAGN
MPSKWSLRTEGRGTKMQSTNESSTTNGLAMGAGRINTNKANIVTNIREAMLTYNVDLTDMGEVKVSVELNKLVFEITKKLSYKLTLKGPSRVHD